MALKLPPSATCSLRPRRGSLVCGYVSSFTAPSPRSRSCPYSFVSDFSFFFCPTRVRGEFLAFWEVWGLLPAFSRCSVWVVPHVDVFLMYSCGGRWSPRLTPPPSWRSLLIIIIVLICSYWVPPLIVPNTFLGTFFLLSCNICFSSYFPSFLHHYEEFSIKINLPISLNWPASSSKMFDLV